MTREKIIDEAKKAKASFVVIIEKPGDKENSIAINILGDRLDYESFASFKIQEVIALR